MFLFRKRYQKQVEEVEGGSQEVKEEETSSLDKELAIVSLEFLSCLSAPRIHQNVMNELIKVGGRGFLVNMVKERKKNKEEVIKEGINILRRFSKLGENEKRISN